jgi:hypothetical protein
LDRRHAQESSCPSKGLQPHAFRPGADEKSDTQS